MDKRAPLRQQFKQFLNEERLNDRQYASLRQKLEQSEMNSSSKTKSSFDDSGSDDKGSSRGFGGTDRYDIFNSGVRRRVIWTVAAVMMTIIMALSVMRILSTTNEETNIPQKIAEEVATNHIKIRHPDLETSSLEDIRIFFDRLDFVPIMSDLIDTENHFLKGARYCTLQGKIAAHLMFDSPQGRSVSHYQTAYDPGRFGPLPDITKDENPRVINSRGVEVQIWVEKDLLMAWAYTIQNNYNAALVDPIPFRME